MSIAESLSALKADKAALAQALRDKGAEVSAHAGFDSFASLIETLSVCPDWAEDAAAATFAPKEDVQGGHAFAYSLPEGKAANMLLLYGDFGGNEYAEGLIGAAGHRLCAEKRPNWDGITLYGTAGGGVSIQNWAGSAATPKGVETAGFSAETITFYPPYSGGTYMKWLAGYTYTLLAFHVPVGD